MSDPSCLFYLPGSIESDERFIKNWDLNRGSNQFGFAATIEALETRLKAGSPVLLVDLGICDLFEQVKGGDSKKSQRFLECCPYSTRIIVDLRPYVFASVLDQMDLDLWDALGKQLAWRLAAHKLPALVIWQDRALPALKPLAILRDSVELWAGPDLIHHNEPKPPAGGRPPISRLCELLRIRDFTCP